MRGNSDLDYHFLGTIYVCLMSYHSDRSQIGRRDEFTATKHLLQESSSPSQATQAKLLLSE